MVKRTYRANNMDFRTDHAFTYTTATGMKIMVGAGSLFHAKEITVDGNVVFELHYQSVCRQSGMGLGWGFDTTSLPMSQVTFWVD
jgi:hypothetical protein